MSEITIPIVDWYGLHDGFNLTLQPGFTALVGPNGAGKTTLLVQIREFAKEHSIDLFEYSNLTDGGGAARQRYLNSSDLVSFATAATSSEGEQVAMNFANVVRKLGAAVTHAKASGKPLIVLLDAIDSGASIDRARDLRDFFTFVSENDIGSDTDVYLVMAVNHFELAKTPAVCINVRTGERLRFDSYDQYADFVCSFQDKYPSRTAS